MLLALILFLGFGNFRSALVVAIVVPLSLLGAFLLHPANLRGAFPANLISLGAIDFGIIVDSAVIIIEDVLLTSLEQEPRTGFRRLCPKPSSRRSIPDGPAHYSFPRRSC